MKSLAPGHFRLPLVLLTALCLTGCHWLWGKTPPNPGPDPKEPARADIPYQLKLEAFSVKGFPGLHSAVRIVHDGKLILMAGRRDGMHVSPLPQPPPQAPPSDSAFPVEESNDTIYVIDLARGVLEGQASVNALPPSVARQLRTTNPQFFSKDGWLYIVGGYGSTLDGQSMETLEQVIAIDLDDLVSAVKKKKPLDQDFAEHSIYLGDHPALRVAGGGMEMLGSDFLLIFGHTYNGRYTTDSALAQQTYSESVRVFRFSFSRERGESGLKTLEVKFKGKNPPSTPNSAGQDPDGPYHRRDLNILQVLGPTGNPRVAALGGVFKGGRMEGYLHPVYLTPSSSAPLGFTLAEDSLTSQWMSHYETGTVPVYSERDKAMFTTSFGGISQYYWDAGTKTLKSDTLDLNKEFPVNGLPFINTVATLKVGTQGGTQFLHEGERFPPVGAEPVCGSVTTQYLGTNGFFIAAAGIPHRHGVILLDELRKPQLVGYLVGGIAATGPYSPRVASSPSAFSCTSSLLYRVILDPQTATKSLLLRQP